MFILVSGCVGTCRGPSALLWPAAYNAVNTALQKRLLTTTESV